jgi:formyltetrahydrofolate deformylase
MGRRYALVASWCRADTLRSVAVLLLCCPDRPGIVARVAGVLHEHGGNIVEADQHTDHEHGLFLQRVEVDPPPGTTLDDLRTAFAPVAAEFDMTWSIHGDQRASIAVLVSKQGHCLYDLLGRAAMGELDADVALVVSNHTDHAAAAERFGVPFRHLPVDPADPAAQHAELLATLVEADVDLVVLARYMQILPVEITERFAHRVINIHHSFLPAFVGARPYHQAHDRGVKLIGATAHYATADLDEGPIICQDTAPVSHRDDIERFVRRGRDLEMVVLARAVGLHLDHRVLAYANRTVVFE